MWVRIFWRVYDYSVLGPLGLGSGDSGLKGLGVSEFRVSGFGGFRFKA